jgi:hypothetical protein
MHPRKLDTSAAQKGMDILRSFGTCLDRVYTVVAASIFGSGSRGRKPLALSLVDSRGNDLVVSPWP